MNRKPKLLRVTTSDVSLDTLIKGQMKFLSSEFEVVGVSNNTGLLQKVAEREGIRVVEIPMHREISLVADVKCLWMLYRLFRKEKPEIVHANTPKGSLLSMVASWAARIPNRLYTVTGLRYQGASGMFKALLMGMEKLTCRFATKVIPEGQGVLKALQEDHITNKPLKVILNGNINGIDTTYFSKEAVGTSREDIRKALKLLPEDFTFIFVGRIVKDKGMNELAECMKLLAGKCKLILVGSFESEVDSLTEGKEAFLRTSEDVKFVGWQKDVRPYLAASDALVFPSYREGFPNVVMQAGAMGLPSIVTDINGCNEIIEDRTNGIIIPSRNQEALLNAMQYFLTDKVAIQQMASCARKMIQDRYEQQQVWEALLAEYKNLLHKK